MTGLATTRTLTAKLMAHEIDVIIGCEAGDLPPKQEFIQWVGAALGQETDFTLSIRVVGEAEGQALNHEYRNKDGATNVLSFPADLPEEVLEALGHRPLGDLAICAPVVAREAQEQGKPAMHHWAHLTVHGVLHLLGYDHIKADDAELMEQREREILAGLGVSDPYA